MLDKLTNDTDNLTNERTNERYGKYTVFLSNLEHLKMNLGSWVMKRMIMIF